MKVMTPFLAVFFAGIVTGVPVIANADVNTTSPGRITFMTSGFASSSMRVTTSAPLFNPEGCPTFDGYITDPADTGSPLYHAILLQAFQTGRPVSLTISGCFVGRPKIIGVSMTSP